MTSKVGVLLNFLMTAIAILSSFHHGRCCLEDAPSCVYCRSGQHIPETSIHNHPERKKIHKSVINGYDLFTGLAAAHPMIKHIYVWNLFENSCINFRTDIEYSHDIHLRLNNHHQIILSFQTF